MDSSEKKIDISVIIPVYFGCEFIPQLYRRLCASLEPLGVNFEIIMINDGSPDNSWSAILELCHTDERIAGINLSRNFGQHYAITAGLDHSVGEWVVVMDGDLQDQPEEIPKLYGKALEGYDIVVGRREQRQDGLLKKAVSRLFYGILSYLTSAEQDGTVANFGIYHRKVIQAVCSLRENLRFFPIMVRWVGFRFTAIPIEHAPRGAGKSSYTCKKLLNLALDVMLAFSDKPLRLTIKLGFLISATALIFAANILFRSFFFGYAVMGWASLIVSLWFFSGLTIFILGIMGIYVGKIFDEVKGRPLYIAREKKNVKAS